jgi:two-component system nitrate/nitrite response regulator NarL
VLLEGSMLAGTANVIPELLRVAPDMKLIVQAVQADENHTVELYRRGVRGIISRSISPDLLVRCVRQHRRRRNLDRQPVGQLGH